MSELTDKQVITKWADIKKQIRERQLLAYRVGIPLDDWDKYMHSTPPADEVNRIYYAIQEDRKIKTLRIKDALSKIVGYRESKDFSRKTRVSDTSIRDIIEGKKDMVGYDVINRLEMFLHVTMPDFELSIENPLSVRSFTVETINDISTKIDQVADSIKSNCFKLTEIARKQKKERDWHGNEIEPTSSLKYNIDRMSELKNEIDLFWDAFLTRK